MWWLFSASGNFLYVPLQQFIPYDINLTNCPGISCSHCYTYCHWLCKSLSFLINIGLAEVLEACLPSPSKSSAPYSLSRVEKKYSKRVCQFETNLHQVNKVSEEQTERDLWYTGPGCMVNSAGLTEGGIRTIFLGTGPTCRVWLDLTRVESLF